VQGSIPKVLDDIATLRPTLFCGVPRVFDRIYGGIYEQVSSWWQDGKRRCSRLRERDTGCVFGCRVPAGHTSGAVFTPNDLVGVCACLLQVSRSFTKRLIFEACLWIKSYRMKRGVKHDKVRGRLLLLPPAA
jgi:hypothetical protein